MRRATARARLVYEPATPGQREVASAQSLASRRSHRPHRGRGTALVSGAIRRLAEPLLPRPRAQGGGEPREVGPTPARGRDARRPTRPTSCRPGRGSPTTPAPLLRPCGCRARSRRARRRRARPPRKPPRSCSACRGSCSTTATAICSRARSPRASAGACRTPRCSTCRSSPRPSASCSSPRGRRTTRAATSTTAPARCRWSRPWRPCPAWSSSTCSARPRCRPCARNSTAPAASRSPITSSTSTATASMTDRRPGRAVLRAARGHRQAGESPPRHRLHRANWARCCATTASRSSSSKPARPRRPRRRPSPSPPSC